MRVPDPKANTTTEAYLAYKAGYLEESELKPVLYEPYLHFDGWLAYWCGLTITYPNDGIATGKNLFNPRNATLGYFYINNLNLTPFSQQPVSVYMEISPNTTYTVTKPILDNNRFGIGTCAVMPSPGGTLTKSQSGNDTDHLTITSGENDKWLVIYFKQGLDTTPVKTIFSQIQIEEGSSATEYEPFQANPEILTDEEALVAYLSGVTDTYPEEIKDPYDVRIVGYLRHLASIRWPEPDYPVNNEEFYLSTMDPTHTSNPVPSSDIELDTAEGKIISVEAYGDTYQQTYSGKNLWGDISSYSRSTNGIDFVTNADGTITASGTATATAYSVLASGAVDAGVYLTLQAGTYTLSEKNGDKVQAVVAESGGAIIADTSTSEVTFTLTQTTNVTIRASISSGTAITGTLTLYPMLETGSSPTSYEPYVGGVPAPNPDYPQAVQVVTGEQTVTIGDGVSSQSYEINLGKNLFDINGTSGAFRANKTISGQTITSTATDTGTGYVAIVIPNSDNLLGKECSISFSAQASIGIARFRITEGASTNPSSVGSVIKTIVGNGSKTEAVTFPTSYGTGKDCFVVLLYPHTDDSTWSVGDYATFTNIQLELGSATTYAPYFEPVELCKIGDYQDYIYKSGDDWYVHKACKSMTLRIANMNNDESYPGWENLASLKADLGIANPSTGNAGHIDAYCPYYTNIKGYVAKNSQTNSDAYISCNFNNYNAIIYLQNSVYGLTQTQWKTQYSNLNFEFYYVLATPTDTKITDATLIGQLEALAGADTYNEKTYIKVTATDPNPPALLKVEAYKY